MRWWTMTVVPAGEANARLLECGVVLEMAARLMLAMARGRCERTGAGSALLTVASAVWAVAALIDAWTVKHTMCGAPRHLRQRGRGPRVTA